jgi:pilus assembly protein CpaB
VRLFRLSRFRLSRSPLAFWVAVALLALATAGVVAKLVGRADALAGRYGPLRPVVVAARSVERGVELAEADVAVRRLPATLLPEGAFASTGGVLGRTTVAPLVAGQLVLLGHLAPDGLSGVAALLPAGTRAVAVPAEGGPALVRRGDLVDVLATFDPSVTGGGEPTVAVALGSLVVDVGTDVVTVAVIPEEARRIAFAIAHGTITLAVTPGLGREGRAEAGRADAARADAARAGLVPPPAAAVPPAPVPAPRVSERR